MGARRVESVDVPRCLPSREIMAAMGERMDILDRKKPSGRADGAYSISQMLIHWTVVVLVFVQWMTFDAIHRTHRTILPPRRVDLVEHAVHTYSGIAIGTLMVLLLGIRFFRGSPPSLDTGWRRALSVRVHSGLYVVLLAQAATGFTATYLFGGAARIHVLLWNVILVLLAFHLAGAAYHLVRRDGIVARMLPRRR